MVRRREEGCLSEEGVLTVVLVVSCGDGCLGCVCVMYTPLLCVYECVCVCPIYTIVVCDTFHTHDDIRHDYTLSPHFMPSMHTYNQHTPINTLPGVV